VLSVWHETHPELTLTLLWNLPLAQVVKLPLWQVSQFAAAAAATDAYGTWFAGRPSAGGNAPLWQLAHWPATTVCVWFHAVGRHAVKFVWQASHDWFAPVGMWFGDLPVALPVPWQVAQVPATTPE
jgi:hypothetical protein